MVISEELPDEYNVDVADKTAIEQPVEKPVEEVKVEKSKPVGGKNNKKYDFMVDENDGHDIYNLMVYTVINNSVDDGMQNFTIVAPNYMIALRLAGFTKEHTTKISEELYVVE